MPVEALSAAPAGVVLENPAGWVEAATERGQALVEWRMRRSDGTEFPAEISCRAMTMDGTPRVLAGVRDVTERKRAEADMLLVREALDDCGTAVLILNQAHRAQYINAAFGSLFGFTPDRAAMVRLGHLFEDAALAETIEANVFSGASWAGEAAMHTKEHRRFPASVRATPVLDEDFTVAGGLLIINDISRRKHMEGQLRQSQNLKSIGQLAAGIAHEINTPMQYVGDNLRFLQGAFGDLLRLVERGGEAAAALGEAAPGHPAEAAFSEAAVDADAEYLAEEAPLALGQSLEGVERVTRIVGAMRQFTHPGAEEKRLADLNAAMESTATVARNEWRYVADLDLDLEDGLPPVPCIPGEINQVFLNLIVNAAHAIGEVVGDGSDGRGRITVTSRSEPGWVTFSVADTGTGITPEVRERIFDPFFTTKEVGQGTGQGLSISYSVITEKHGGELTFETEVGRGSVFHVRLPLAPPDEAGE
jgi:signal transduction histidine kinase